ncbi:HAD family hydrolase [Pseudoroseomonas globiformis]|uniref:HAD family hydrolase n=1 Tax=Teichococcus globiformis TaxID=2307229 RepID=A0ABV7G6L2_9PROT
MMPIARRALGLGLLSITPILAAGHVWAQAQRTDPLPSWRDGASRQSILDFLAAVTTEGSPDFVPVPQRIAVFDNDGTLWCEIPTAQLMFVLDRVKALAPHYPAWRTTQPFKAALEGDTATLAAAGTHGLAELALATHANTTPEQFNVIATEWLATARHPKFQRSYTELTYQPMLELLRLLASSGFRNYIVSGGGVEFIRAFSDSVYDIPPEQVIGSTIRTEYRFPHGGKPELFRVAVMDFIDDGPGKPVAIGKFIGRRPIAAFGNSDGDLEMLQYVTSGPGRRFGLLVHHDDAEREVAYDRQSPFGKLDRGLDLAGPSRWTVASMRQDWNRMFPVQ